MYGHIYYNVQRPDDGLLARVAGVSTSALSDAMGRHGALSYEIAPVRPGQHMVGSALTVLCFPGDNLMTHKAIQMIQPGDVLVIDDGDHRTGCFGFKSLTMAKNRGAAGLVAAGSVRDLAEIRTSDFPVYCRGGSPRAPQKNTPGSINVPVHVGGIVITPGDIVVGDDDGVVVVPLPDAERVLEAALARERAEAKEAAAGTFTELPPDPGGGTMSLDKLLAGRVTEHHEPAPWRRG